MRIFEVKNNLIKLFFDNNEKLFLAGFLMIKDSRETYIAQIMHVETNKHGNMAIARLIYNVTPDGNLVTFEGTVPSINSVLALLNLSDIVKLLEGENPINIGNLAQDNISLKIDLNFIKNKLLVLSENQENSDLIVRKLNDQTKLYNKRTVIIDIVGTYEKTDNTLVAGKNFKLPVNYETLGFISEKGIDYKTPKSKAVIQETFLELQYYVKTIENQYIPVTSLIDILEAQYKSSKLLELVLIKNALLKYHEKGILAESKKDFLNLNKSLIENSTTLIDLSNVEEEVQREYIAFIYNRISKMNEEVIVFANINNGNSDKKLLKQMYFTKNINTVSVLPYTYKYLNELKKISKNLILFTPTLMQDDFESYNTFLSKLAKWEYIAYGKETQYLPFIVSLKTEKGIFNDTFKTSDNVDNATSEYFKDRMKELVKKQYNDVINKQQEDRFKQQLVEKQKMEQQALMQNQMQQLAQRQAMETGYPMPQYNYSHPYMQMMAQPYYQPQPMPYPMPMPYMQPQVMYPQQPAVSQNQQQQEIEIIKPESLENFDLEQLDKLYTNSPVENAFNNIKSNTAEINQPLKGFEEKVAEKPQTKPKSEQKPQPEPKNEPKIAQEPAPVIEIEEENFAELTEEDLDMISEIEVELHEEEQKEKEKEEQPIIPDFIDNESQDNLPVFPQPELINKNKREFEKNDKVRHAKFGDGVVEKVINYGSKKLCSIYFEKVGRRLLEPNISELEKI